MQPRLKLLGSFQGYLYEYGPDGELECVTEINTDLNNIATDVAAEWFARGGMILGIEGGAVPFSDAFVYGLAGRPVKVDVPVDDALQKIYTLPAEVYTE